MLRPPKCLTSTSFTYFRQKLTTALLESVEGEKKVCGLTKDLVQLLLLIQEGQLSVSGESMCKVRVRLHTFVSPSADSRRAVVSFWQKYVHEALVNRLVGLSLLRKSVVRLTDRLDMTSAVYCGG